MQDSENNKTRKKAAKVEPITDLKDIQTIKKLLKDKPRDYCLFVLGINTNLRASDLRRIKVGQVESATEGTELVLNEQKTKKERRITLNRAACEAIHTLLAASDLQSEDDLFTSQRGTLTVQSIHRLVKSWCREINLKGNYGSHTLRKTFGYHQRVQLNTSIAELMVMFNHSTQKQTLDYLCIQPSEIEEAYLKLCL
ncbi:tyrosine-type recombinase/integrase [Desulfosediminicola sp.]|uniref:tyrosine-type recombinase/integrase n=1 Tax=Desulfosediminicola sp. TaxID=2886825 RepID=UPI003AF2DC39